MTGSSRILRLAVLAALGVLSACGGGGQDDGSDAAAGTVAVTTVAPHQQTFHDTVEALGSALGDPQRARTLSLAYAGQIVAVKVAAGQSVQRGQPLLSVSADPATRSAYQQAQAALDLARGDLQRSEQLAAQRLATQSQVAAARKALADAQAALHAQQAIGGGAAEDVVTAPVDGVVTAVQVGLGERVAANAPLLGFTPAHALLAQLGVQPERGAELRVGMPVRLESVYGAAEAFHGTLRMVGHAVDPQTHLLPVQVELPAGAGARLVAGAALAAQIDTDAYRAWAIPRNAVLRDEQGSYLFQVYAGHAKRVDVTLRRADGDTLGVEGPLDPRAPIIVLGVYELGDGDAVRVTSAPVAGAATAGTSAASTVVAPTDTSR